MEGGQNNQNTTLGGVPKRRFQPTAPTKVGPDGPTAIEEAAKKPEAGGGLSVSGGRFSGRDLSDGRFIEQGGPSSFGGRFPGRGRTGWGRFVDLGGASFFGGSEQQGVSRPKKGKDLRPNLSGTEEEVGEFLGVSDPAQDESVSSEPESFPFGPSHASSGTAGGGFLGVSDSAQDESVSREPESFPFGPSHASAGIDLEVSLKISVPRSSLIDRLLAHRVSNNDIMGMTGQPSSPLSPPVSRQPSVPPVPSSPPAPSVLLSVPL